MVNYQNGKIYKIESNLGNKIYIGSTTKQYLSQRMDKHRSNYRCWQVNKKRFLTSVNVFEAYGVENCNIILIEAFPCNSKDELLAREAHYIRTLDCENKVFPKQTYLDYYEKIKKK